MDWLNAITAIFTAVGAMGTFVAIAVAIRTQRRATSETRIRDVINRFLDLKVSSEPAIRHPSTETLLVRSGGFFLTNSEWGQCVRILTEAHLLGRDSAMLDQELLREAVERGVNLEDFASRAGFRIGHALREQAKQEDASGKT